jgi:hypothetical protein
MHNIFGTDGISLHFPEDKLYEEYRQEEQLLRLKYYIWIRNKHGIWASSQNKFVERVPDLQPMDSIYEEALLVSYQNRYGFSTPIVDRGLLEAPVKA